MSFRYIKKTVEEFQTPNTTVAKTHYEDLKRASMMLYNELARRLRSGATGSKFFVDVVLKASNVIEDTTLMREFIKDDENRYKQRMIDYYHGEEMEYKVPYAVSNVEAFRNKKTNMVKDTAVEVVTKMYRIYCEDRRDS